jgi:antirestriction protein
MSKKIVEFEIEDIGMEHSQYFQGRGTSHSKWDDVSVGIGMTQKEAVDDAIEMLAQQGYEISTELEADADKADNDHQVVTSLDVTLVVTGKEVLSAKVDGEADLLPSSIVGGAVKRDSVSEDAIEEEVTYSACGGNTEDLANEILQAIGEDGLQVSEVVKKEIEDAGHSMNDSEHYYHVAVYVKGGEGSKDESVKKRSKPIKESQGEISFSDKESQMKALAAWIDENVKSNTEYETEHEDSGQDYLDALGQTITTDALLAINMTNNELWGPVEDALKAGLSKDDITAILSSLAKPEASGVFYPMNAVGGSGQIGEVETQLDGNSGIVNGEEVEDIFKALVAGLSEEDKAKVTKDLNEAYWDGKSNYAYGNASYDTWMFVVDRDELVDALNDKLADEGKESVVEAKDPVCVVVKDKDGKVTQRMGGAEFMKALEMPKTASLADAVKKYNDSHSEKAEIAVKGMAENELVTGECVVCGKSTSHKSGDDHVCDDSMCLKTYNKEGDVRRDVGESLSVEFNGKKYGYTLPEARDVAVYSVLAPVPDQPEWKVGQKLHVHMDGGEVVLSGGDTKVKMGLGSFNELVMGKTLLKNGEEKVESSDGYNCPHCGEPIRIKDDETTVADPHVGVCPNCGKGTEEPVKESVKTEAKAPSGPAVYVGTYAKYNDGSIKGAWLNLEDYADKDEFLEACKELHKDEEDPEPMFQGYEGFPERYYSESSIDEKVWDWLNLDEEDRKILEAYIDLMNDSKATIDQAKDAYMGQAKSKEDWAADFLEETGGLSKDNAANYLTMSETDMRLIASEEADRRVGDMKDSEVISDADKEEELEAAEAAEEELAQLQDELDGLDEEDPEDKSRVQEIKDRMLTLTDGADSVQKVIDDAREELRDRYSSDIQEQLQKDAVGYFMDELGYGIEEIMKLNLFSIDYEAYARDAEMNGSVSFVDSDDGVMVFHN